MPMGRPVFPYPQLVRVARWRVRLAAGGAAATKRAKGSFAPRHGKAVEPGVWDQPQELKGQRQNQSTPPLLPPADAQLVPAKGTVLSATPAKQGESEKEYHQPENSQQVSQSESKPSPAPDAKPGSSTAPDEAIETSKPPNGKDGDEVAQQTGKSVSAAKNSRPLEAVLLMEAPERVAHQHPHMAPPPYVHHFDSYSLVKQLQEGGYTREQATTSMKGIRTLLAQNLDVAQQSLVSKSDVENVGHAPGEGGGGASY